MRWIAGLILCSTAVAMPAAAQDAAPFDGSSFVEQLNEAISAGKLGGVQVKGQIAPELMFSKGGFGDEWAKALYAKTPDFGFVVLDASKRPIDVLGAEVPYKVLTDNSVAIAGYRLPTGGEVKLVGPAEWSATIARLAAADVVKPPSDDIMNALTAVRDATDYVAAMMCDLKSRPTKLTLSITAGFKLAFNVETGSEVEWDLEIVCARYQVPPAG